MPHLSEAKALPARAGLGLKPEHYSDILGPNPDIGFFEVHAENYMGDGGPPHRYLAAIRERYALSLHGVGLSIGGVDALDKAHLKRLKQLVERYQPQSFSEHLAWSTHDGDYLNDLLPVPYTPETLARVAEHIDEVQQAVGRRMLLENPSTYVVFAESSIEETAFLDEIAARTGCGLLLDVNNVMVSSVNQGLDPHAYLDRFPLDRVGEIHLAGYDETVDDAGERLLIDAHGSRVRPDVFALFTYLIDKTGPLPVLVEWDNNVPDFATLADEARLVDQVLGAASAPAMRQAS